jgi:hypothetical protein
VQTLAAAAADQHTCCAVIEKYCITIKVVCRCRRLLSAVCSLVGCPHAGMMCALAGASIWLLFATYLELPVSSTQSIVASVAGM